MKYVLDLTVKHTQELKAGYALICLTNTRGSMPEASPGQFVELRVDGSPSTFLRRPVSINHIDSQANELWLLVHAVGDGTRRLAALEAGDVVNTVMPLGRGFSLPAPAQDTADAQRCLLVGGGVGTAPLLFLGEELKERGHKPVFLLGGRTASDIMQADLFSRLGEVYVTTEDGSAGERGFVTQHSIWKKFTPQSSMANGQRSMVNVHSVYTCGPKPMMQAVARLCHEAGTPCEASLENLMACGLGACLCCVEETTDGNLCVCKEGPVFNTARLKWVTPD